MTPKQSINLVWFKRDLRLTDHAPLVAATRSPHPVLLLYIFEPALVKDDHYDLRHWRFIWQSLDDMQQQLSALGTKLTIAFDEPLRVFSMLQDQFDIQKVFSHEETGLEISFARDRQVKQWFTEQQIEWLECPTGAVIRGAPDRADWDQRWQALMRAEILNPDLQKTQFVESSALFNQPLPEEWQLPDPLMQRGGESMAHHTLRSFFAGRGQAYQRSISKPEASRRACSRMSPYLAWGNISLRQFYTALRNHWQQPGWRRALSALSSRLHWHCHFIQKFESEADMEFRPVNRAYLDFPYRDDASVESDLHAWETGNTGFPMVDASMRCVMQTGYLNFRMRSMLVSFLCHHLLIDWRRGVKHLARQFLDFEPGIHYPQFQMQASVTGTNTIRMYNPIKQGTDNDPDAEFIKRWCPELSELPVELIHQLPQLTAMDRMLHDIDYPDPIVDLQQAGQRARDLLWSWRKRQDVRRESARIVARHVRPDN